MSISTPVTEGNEKADKYTVIGWFLETMARNDVQTLCILWLIKLMIGKIQPDLEYM